MKSLLVAFLLAVIFLAPTNVVAQGRDFGLGVHILSPDELGSVVAYRGNAATFYVTVPFHLNDRREATWNLFFQKCRDHAITPILRLSTEFDAANGYWLRPTRNEIVEAATFMQKLHWEGNRMVILFNEPNHATEWGGAVDPYDYADTAMFAASWLHTEPVPYLVLLAGMDAAAPNGPHTLDSFNFLDQIFWREPDLVNWINGWASHSYPNPGFVASPYKTGKNSLRGFEEELKFLSKFSKNDLPVYITETGWRQTRQITPLLGQYYKYAYEKIWSHPQVKGVTVFLLQGAPGPFAEFSLLNQSGGITPQLDAFGTINKQLGEENED